MPFLKDSKEEKVSHKDSMKNIKMKSGSRKTAVINVIVTVV